MNSKPLAGVALAVALIAWAPATSAQNAWTSYLVVSEQGGGGPGPFEGTRPLPDGNGLGFLLQGFHHLVTTNDGTTGVQHKPFVLNRPMDKASARFFEAFVTQEPLEVVVQVFNGPQKMYEIELLDARIVALEPISVESELDPDKLEELEKIRFMYRGFTLRDIVAGTEAVWQLTGWPS